VVSQARVPGDGSVEKTQQRQNLWEPTAAPILQKTGVRPDIEKLSPDVKEVYEEIGVMINGRWKTDEELTVEWRELYPTWEPSPWPMGSPDIASMDATDVLVNPLVGGDPDAYPMGAPMVLTMGEILVDALGLDSTVKMGDADDRWNPCAGGAPANVAAALAKLGTPAAFAGSVADDADGRLLLRTLRDAKLPTKPVQVVVGGTTRRVFVTRSDSGDRSFAGFPAETDSFADTVFDLEQFDGTLLYAVDYFVTGTLGLANPATKAALLAAKEVADINQVVTIVDVNWRPTFWNKPGMSEAAIRVADGNARRDILKYIDGACFVKMTDEEAQFLFGVDREKCLNNPKEVLDYLPGTIGVLITAGAKGCAYAFEDLGGCFPAFKVPVVDSTGAGDAFTAGFIHKMIQMTNEWQLEQVEYGLDKPLRRGHLRTRERLKEAFKDKAIAAECVVYAAAVGAMTCMDEGAIAAQPPERLVNKFVQVYGDDILIVEEKRKASDKFKFKPLGWQFSR